MLFHNKTYKFNSPIFQIDRIYLLNGGSGGSRGGARGPPAPLFLDQTEARRAEKKTFFGDCAPLISETGWPPHPFPLIWRSGSATVRPRPHESWQATRICKSVGSKTNQSGDRFLKVWGFAERIHYFRVIYALSKTPGVVRTCRDVA